MFHIQNVFLQVEKGLKELWLLHCNSVCDHITAFSYFIISHSNVPLSLSFLCETPCSDFLALTGQLNNINCWELTRNSVLNFKELLEGSFICGWLVFKGQSHSFFYSSFGFLVVHNFLMNKRITR